MPQIQWYPGHMAKTMRELKEKLNLCDCVLEVCDARIPSSSRNPFLQELLQHKQKIVILNKGDLADPRATELWLSEYRKREEPALAGDARSKSFADLIRRKALELNREVLERARARGRVTRPVRLLVVGIPNSGKSTLINTLCGKHSAQTSNRPGVTRSLSWLKAGTDLLLLDSPGVLWPKLESRHEQLALGACAAIKDDIMPLQELASELLYMLYRMYPEKILDLSGSASSYLPEDPLASGKYLLEQYGLQRKHISQGGVPDLERSARTCLKEFRSGEMGRLSLELPSGFIREEQLPDA